MIKIWWLYKEATLTQVASVLPVSLLLDSPCDPSSVHALPSSSSCLTRCQASEVHLILNSKTVNPNMPLSFLSSFSQVFKVTKKLTNAGIFLLVIKCKNHSFLMYIFIFVKKKNHSISYLRRGKREYTESYIVKKKKKNTKLAQIKVCSLTFKNLQNLNPLKQRSQNQCQVLGGAKHLPKKASS